MHRKTRRLRRRIAALAVVAVVIGGLWFAVASFNVEMHRIATGSMDPTLPVGSRVITTTTDQLRPGDIILFHNYENGGLTAHRFIGYAPDDSLMTKGDANPTPDVHDQPLHRSDVVGTVRVHIDILTASFWTSRRGIGVEAVVLIVLLMRFGVDTSPTPDRTRKGTRPAPTPV